MLDGFAEVLEVLVDTLDEIDALAWDEVLGVELVVVATGILTGTLASNSSLAVNEAEELLDTSTMWLLELEDNTSELVAVLETLLLISDVVLIATAFAGTLETDEDDEASDDMLAEEELMSCS